ncbi:MAG TPA: response regulator transcription factor [Solirubrobacterales bacterium]|nr:response regulator transcription factor [Solirubrobacterales bacterium]
MVTSRVVICDDHAIVREALKNKIGEAAELKLVGEAADGEAVVETALDLKPDLLIIDVEMPKTDGISAMSSILEKEPEIKVLIFTAHQQPNVIDLAVRCGASGYLLKSASTSEIRIACKAVLSGGEYFPDRHRTPAPDERDELERLRMLSARERQILDLLATGMRARGVAEEIGIQPATVYTHVRNVVLKLGVDTRTQAVAIATKYSFLDPEHPDGTA